MEKKFGQFRVDELFDKKTIKGVPKKEEKLSEVKNGYHIFGQNILYQYPQKILLDKKYLCEVKKDEPILAYTSSVAEIGMIEESFYRSGDNGAFQGLFAKEKHKYNRYELLYILGLLKRHFNKMGYTTSMGKVVELKINMPIKDEIEEKEKYDIDEIDYNYMAERIKELEAERIKELEAERIKELEAYLRVSGLENYEISKEDEEVLNRKVKFKEFRVGDIFEKIEIKKIDVNLKECPKIKTKQYDLPARTCATTNQGLSCYVERSKATVLNNCLSVSANGDFSAYYQDEDFTILQDCYALRDIEKKMNRNEYLYCIGAMYKSFGKKYGWTNKSGWNRIKEDVIEIPIKNNNIDYDYMDRYIEAMKKKAIRGVIEYKDKVIEITKKVV